MPVDIPTDVCVLLPALLLEATVGYPTAVYDRITHPVVWIGKLIDTLERRWNRTTATDSVRRLLGIATVVILLACSIGCGLLIDWLASKTAFGAVVLICAATTGLAQRSLYLHARAVLQPLNAGELAGARLALSRIVGRDTAQLDEHGIAAATLESLSESFNDAVVAPAFWFALCGLPGMFGYKALNTADSMIGHREPRWRMFGWAAARSDDLANLLPARLAGLLISICAWRGLGTMWRDAGKHDSPNAGWPEAAMAGALNVSLGGATSYDGVVHERATFGSGARPTTRDLASGMRIYVRACCLLWLLAGLLVATFYGLSLS